MEKRELCRKFHKESKITFPGYRNWKIVCSLIKSFVESPHTHIHKNSICGRYEEIKTLQAVKNNSL